MPDGEVVYRFKAEDGISGPMREAKANIEATADAMSKTKAGLDEGASTAQRTGQALEETTQAAQQATQAQEAAILKSVETLSALHGIQSGLSAVTSSLNTLGLVDEETYKTLQKVTAGVQLVVGTAQAVKGVTTLFQGLNSVLKTTAIVSTFASIAENPAKGALIVGGAALAAGAVGGYMMSSINNNKSTTINVAHESTARQAQTVMDAGAWY